MTTQIHPSTLTVEHLECPAADGRLRMQFAIDGYCQRINAWFHNRPALSEPVWDRCARFLAMTCMVDLAAASRCEMVDARRIRSDEARLLQVAAEAIRLEEAANNGDPLDTVPLRIRTSSRRLRKLELPRRLDRNRVLVLMGGGKDSLYTYHLLQKAGFDIRCFYLTEASRIWQQLRNVWTALSRASPQDRAFLNANQLGRLGDHFGRPYLNQFQIGQVIAMALPYALLHGCKYLALGVERGVNRPNRTYRGRRVSTTTLKMLKSKGLVGR